MNKGLFGALICTFLIGFVAAANTVDVTTNTTGWISGDATKQINVTFTTGATSDSDINEIDLWIDDQPSGDDQFDMTSVSLWLNDLSPASWTETFQDWDNGTLAGDGYDDLFITQENGGGNLQPNDALAMTFTLTPLNTGNYTWWYNATYAVGANATGFFTIALDMSAPTIPSVGWNASTVNPTVGEDNYANASATFVDGGVGLDNCWIESNETGSYVNNSYEASCDGTVERIFDMSAYPNDVICYFAHANDTGNFHTNSSIQCVTMSDYTTEVTDIGDDSPIEYGGEMTLAASYNYTNGTAITVADTANFEVDGTNYTANFDSGSFRWEVYLDSQITLAVGTHSWIPYFELVDHSAGIGATQGITVNPDSTQVSSADMSSNTPSAHNEAITLRANYNYTNGTAIDVADTAEFEFSGVNHTASWNAGMTSWTVQIPAASIDVGTYNWKPWFEYANHETKSGAEKSHTVTAATTQVTNEVDEEPTEYSDSHSFYARYQYSNGTDITRADKAVIEINNWNFTLSWNDPNWEVTIPAANLSAGNYTWTPYFELANHETGVGSANDFDVALTSTIITGIGSSSPDEYSEAHTLNAVYKYTNGTDITTVDTAEFEINGINYTGTWSGSAWVATIPTENLPVGNYTWSVDFLLANHESQHSDGNDFDVARTSTQISGEGSTTPDEYSDTHTIWANYKYINGTDITTADTAEFEFDGVNYSASWSSANSRWEVTSAAATIIEGNYTWTPHFIKTGYEPQNGASNDFDVAKTSTQISEVGSDTPDEYSNTHTLYASYNYTNGTAITVADTAKFEFDGENETATYNPTTDRWEVTLAAADYETGTFQWKPYFELVHHETQLGGLVDYVITPTSTQITGEGSSTPDVVDEAHTLYANYQYTNGTDITVTDMGSANFTFNGVNYSATWNAGDSRWELELPSGSVPSGSYTWTPYFDLANHAGASGASNSFLVSYPHQTNVTVNETSWLNENANYQVNFTIWNEGASVYPIENLSIYEGLLSGEAQFEVLGISVCNSTGVCTAALDWTTTGIVDEDTDGVDERVNSSTIISPLAAGDYMNVTLTLDALVSGNATWYVETRDIDDNYYTSTTNLALDFVAPQHSSLLPANGTTTTEDDYLSAYGGNVSVSISDPTSGINSVVLWHNASGSWVSHAYTGTAGGNYNYTFTSDLDAGERVDWYYESTDVAGNSATSVQKYFLVTNRAPVASAITAVSPANGAYTTDSTPTLDWSDGTDADDDTLTYDLTLANSSNSFDYYAIAASTKTIADLLVDGAWQWNVTVVDNHTSDANQNSSSSTVFTMVVDTTSPTFAGERPSNGTISTPCATSQDVSAVVSDTLSGVDTVRLYYNETGSWAYVTPTNSSGNYTYDITGLTAGQRVDWYFWANDSAGNTATSDTGYVIAPAAFTGSTTYGTIQAAVMAASAGNTVYVCDGTHSESLTFHNRITLQSMNGADAATLDTSSGAITLPGPNGADCSGSTISGFTITSNQANHIAISQNVNRVTIENCVFYQTASSGSIISAYNSDDFLAQANKFYYSDKAIDFNPATGATVSNNIRVISNEFHASDATSNAAVFGAVEGVRITQNMFNGTEVKFALCAADSNNITISNNEFFNTEGSILIDEQGTSAGASDALSNFTVQLNEFTNNTRGIYFTGNLEDDDVDLSSVNITYNNFVNSSSGGAATDKGIYTSLTLLDMNATYNYWGNATGPTHASNSGGSGTEISDYVRFDPYALGPGRATMNASGQEIIEGDYNVTDATELVIANAQAAAAISIPSNVTNATLNMEGIADFDEDTGDFNVTLDGGMNLTTDTSVGEVEIKIPAGIVISGTTTGAIALNVPQVKASSTVTATPDSGKTASVDSVIEIGMDDVALTFDKAVRVKIAGAAGKYAGYSRSGNFYKITTTCTADTQTAGDALAAGGDCKIDVGSDLVIWTKHFTKFVSYTQAAVASTTPTAEESSTTSGWFTSVAPDTEGYALEISHPATVRTVAGESATFSVVVSNTGEKELLETYIEIETPWNSTLNSIDNDSKIDLAVGEKKLYLVTITPPKSGTYGVMVKAGANHLTEEVESNVNVKVSGTIEDLDEGTKTENSVPVPISAGEPEVETSVLETLASQITSTKATLSEEGLALLSQAERLSDQAMAAQLAGDYDSAKALYDAATAKLNEAKAYEVAEPNSYTMYMAIALILALALYIVSKPKAPKKADVAKLSKVKPAK